MRKCENVKMRKCENEEINTYLYEPVLITSEGNSPLAKGVRGIDPVKLIKMKRSCFLRTINQHQANKNGFALLSFIGFQSP
jgi:hypothetical protein